MGDTTGRERNLRRDAILEAITLAPGEEARNYLNGAIGILEAVTRGDLDASNGIPAVFTMLARALVFSEAV